MNARQLSYNVIELKPQDGTDRWHVYGLVKGIINNNNGTVFSAPSVSQLMREQYGLYIDPHIVIETLEKMTRSGVMAYDHIDRDGRQNYILL